jgi:hypothetical protein
MSRSVLTNDLRDGVDYIDTGEKVSISTTSGPRITKKVIHVLLSDGREAWKCRDCDFLSHASAGSVISHRRAHMARGVEKRAPWVEEKKTTDDLLDLALKAAAFDLLPPALRRSLLARVKASRNGL